MVAPGKRTNISNLMSLFFSCPRIPVTWRYAGILVLVSLMACQGGEFTRFEESPVIDRLLDAAPHFVVNTDTEPERWVATTRIGLPSDSLILGQPTHMITIGGSIYVSDESGHHIFAIGADGYLRRKIGRQGQGPGEFNNAVEGLQYNGSHVFIWEYGRVQVLTETFEYVDSFFSMDYLMDGFSVSPKYIFLQCPGSPEGYPRLVCVRSAAPPHDGIPGIALLPSLDLPNQGGENRYLVTVTPDGNRIALAYKGLQYIFVYDDQFRHVRTIRFAGKEVDNFQPTGFPGVELPAGADAFTQAFLFTMKFVDSRYLMVTASRGGGGGDYLLDVSEDDYRLAKKIVFQFITDTEERERISADDFLLHGDHLYVSSEWQEYIYGYPFNLE